MVFCQKYWSRQALTGNSLVKKVCYKTNLSLTDCNVFDFVGSGFSIWVLNFEFGGKTYHRIFEIVDEEKLME